MRWSVEMICNNSKLGHILWWESIYFLHCSLLFSKYGEKNSICIEHVEEWQRNPLLTKKCYYDNKNDKSDICKDV